jgi:hypothetical protein
MIAQLLMRFIADMIFESAAARKRSYEKEIDRYLEARGFIPEQEAAPAPR